MTVSIKAATPAIIWENLAFFVVTGLVAVMAAPLYLFYFSLPSFYIWLTVFYIVACGLSISAGYHRLFSHVTYKAHPVLQFLLLFFGAATFQHSALRWSSQHRDHHNYVATREDPYNIRQGFFHAHIGWLIFWKRPIDYSNVPDLAANPLAAHQDKHYFLWAIVAGFVTPLLAGFLYNGDLVAAFIFPVCLRVVVVHHATFCVNSICHTFGKEPYDLTSTAKDNWMVALITNGEGFHNYHHRFPNDYRNGIYWYQWDLAKWFIAALSRVRLTCDLKKMSKFGILMAQLKTNQTRLRTLLSREKKMARLEEYYSDTERSYRILKSRLLTWEQRSKEYGNLLHNVTTALSKLIRNRAKHKVNTAKLRYRHADKQRKRFHRSKKSNLE